MSRRDPVRNESNRNSFSNFHHLILSSDQRLSYPIVSMLLLLLVTSTGYADWTVIFKDKFENSYSE